MKPIKILWIDDEIDLLNLHLKFLEAKGYQVETASNTIDAEDVLKNQDFDIIFLDENMPGMTGLNFLSKIQQLQPFTPVVMITKVEDERIMEEAIGSKISDYLIKPVNPKQILLVIKKHVQRKTIISEKTIESYRKNFSFLAMDILNAKDINAWIRIYKQLVDWELELQNTSQSDLIEIIESQKEDANNEFAKFVKSNYLDWVNASTSPFFLKDVFRRRIFPTLQEGKKIFLIVIDNLRYDQWKMLQLLIKDDYKTLKEEIILSILPTATQYARNAFFAGIFPVYIKKQYPKLWKDEVESGNKNDFEDELLRLQIAKESKKIDFNYYKIFNESHSKKVIDNLASLQNKSLNVLVFNFVDMLSHAKTSVQMVKELAKDEAAYRSLTQIWFEHSYLNTLFKRLKAYDDVEIFLTTDHGSILVKNPIKIVGDRETSTNLRYKQGKNLNFKSKKVFILNKPQEAGLPVSHLTAMYVFAQGRDFFVYPNNYSYFVNYYRDTFQHGGISLEEMLIPLVHLVKK